MPYFGPLIYPAQEDIDLRYRIDAPRIGKRCMQKADAYMDLFAGRKRSDEHVPVVLLRPIVQSRGVEAGLRT